MSRKQQSYVPARGDAVWITLDPQAGQEPRGRRPALVVSPASYNGRVGLAFFCPITNRVKGYPFEVVVPEGLAVSGVILADEVKSLAWRARDTERICALPEEVVALVVQRLTVLIAN